MKSEAEWDGFGSYEAYINRGLGGVFNADKGKHAASNNSKQPIKPIKSQRRKPKDVYEIVESNPHHEGDKQWIANELLKLPLAKRGSVMLRYGQEYSLAEDADKRRKANKWLLNYIESQ